MGHGGIFKVDLIGMEHPLRFEDVAVRHVLDAYVTRTIVVPEGNLRQDGLHVSVV